MGATPYSSPQPWSTFDEDRFRLPNNVDAKALQQEPADMGVDFAHCSPEQSNVEASGDVVDSYFQDKYLSSEEDLSATEEDHEDDFLSIDGNDRLDEDEASSVTREDIANELLRSCKLAVAVSIVAAGRPRVVDLRRPRAKRSFSTQSRQHQESPTQPEAIPQPSLRSRPSLSLRTHARTFSTMSSSTSSHRHSILSFLNAYSSSGADQTDATKRTSLMSGFSKSNRSSTISNFSPPDMSSSPPPIASTPENGCSHVAAALAATPSPTSEYSVDSPVSATTSLSKVTSSPVTSISSPSSRNRLRDVFLTRLAGNSLTGGKGQNKRQWRRAGIVAQSSPTSTYSAPSPTSSQASGEAGMSQPAPTTAPQWPPRTSSAAADEPFRLRLPSFVTEGHEGGKTTVTQEGEGAGEAETQRPAKRPLLEFSGR